MIESENGDCYTEVTRTTETAKLPKVKSDKTPAEAERLWNDHNRRKLELL